MSYASLSNNLNAQIKKKINNIDPNKSCDIFNNINISISKQKKILPKRKNKKIISYKEYSNDLKKLLLLAKYI